MATKLNSTVIQLQSLHLSLKNLLATGVYCRGMPLSTHSFAEVLNVAASETILPGNKEAGMKGLRITETGGDHLAEHERQQLEDALRILARKITRAVLRERSLLERSQPRGLRGAMMRALQTPTAREPDEPLTLSVPAAARILGPKHGFDLYSGTHRPNTEHRVWQKGLHPARGIREDAVTS